MTPDAESTAIHPAAEPSNGGPRRKEGRDEESLFSRILHASRVEQIGAVYVLVLIIILFSLLEPSLFPTTATLKTVLNGNAIAALAGLALIVPLATGVFDLSIGYTMALVSVVIAWLIVEHGMSTPLAVVIAMAMALAVGLINGLVVVVLGIDSFIATLGTGSILAAVNLLISHGITVTSAHLNQSLGKVATTNIIGLQTPVYVALVVALLLLWLLERTVTGRRLYATGFNEQAARLAGVRTKRLRFIGLMCSALIAGLAGLLLTAQTGAGNPEIGQSYLLDAFAVAFLGATQIRSGRFNPIGTLIGVLVLGTGTAGLTLIGAEAWTLNLYTGVVLLVALALTKLERTQVRSGKAA
jgi:ribose transport system permease protein